MSETLVPKIVHDHEFGDVVQIVGEIGDFAGYDPTDEQIADAVIAAGLSVVDCIRIARQTAAYHSSLVAYADYAMVDRVKLGRLGGGELWWDEAQSLRGLFTFGVIRTGDVKPLRDAAQTRRYIGGNND